MNYLLLFLGIGIILIAIYDLTFTTLSPNGAGFFTDIITKSFYRLFRRICVRTNSMKLFESVGTVIVGIILVSWYLSIWVGSSLIICSDPNSIVSSDAELPVSTVEKFYYTGFTLSTLGMGDFVAGSDGWRIFTIFLSFSGFVLITTGVSYMVPVLSAIVDRRKLANYIVMLGGNPQNILQKQWQNGDFRGLETHFDRLTGMLVKHSQQMLAYPVIHCFYTTDPKKTGPLNITRLDEVLTILLLDIPPEYRPSSQSIYPLREAITYYFTIRKHHFVDLDPEEPSVPRLDNLKKAGIPLLHDPDSLHDAYRELGDRRRLIDAILRSEGRDFNDIYKKHTDYEIQL